MGAEQWLLFGLFMAGIGAVLLLWRAVSNWGDAVGDYERVLAEHPGLLWPPTNQGFHLSADTLEDLLFAAEDMKAIRMEAINSAEEEGRDCPYTLAYIEDLDRALLEARTVLEVLSVVVLADEVEERETDKGDDP